MIYGSYFGYSQYYACWYTDICSQHSAVYSFRTSHYYTGSISGCARYCGDSITRRVFCSHMVQYLQVRYSGHTPSTRRVWPSVVLLTYSQYGSRSISASNTILQYSLAARKRSTRKLRAYLGHCCDASCCSCCSKTCCCCCCCCCPSGAFAVDEPPSPAASEEAPVLARFATVCLLNSVLCKKQQYYRCTPPTLNTPS